MNVLGIRSPIALRSIAAKTTTDGLEAIRDLRVLCVSQYARGQQRACVRLAGHDLLVQEFPVELDGTLPVIKCWVQGLAKAAGPHLGGMLAHEFSPPFVVVLFSCGISEPRLSVMRPVRA